MGPASRDIGQRYDWSPVPSHFRSRVCGTSRDGSQVHTLDGAGVIFDEDLSLLITSMQSLFAQSKVQMLASKLTAWHQLSSYGDVSHACEVVSALGGEQIN